MTARMNLALATAAVGLGIGYFALRGVGVGCAYIDAGAASWAALLLMLSCLALAAASILLEVRRVRRFTQDGQHGEGPHLVAVGALAMCACAFLPMSLAVASFC